MHDSSVIIELLRKKNKDKSLFARLTDEYTEFAISSITYYEVGIGNRGSHQEFWSNFLRQVQVLSFDQVCAEKAISTFHELKSENNLIDLADLMIGATALAHSLPLATLNKKHFTRIPLLEVI